MHEMRLAIDCVYLLAFLVTASTALVVWGERCRTPVAVGFAAVLSSGSWWSLLVLLENVAPTPSLRVLALTAWLVAPRMAALAFLHLVVRLFEASLPRLRVVAVGYVLACVAVVALPATRPWLLRSADVHPDGVLRWDPGPLFWVLGGVDLTLFAGAALVVAHGITHGRPARRRQLGSVLLAAGLVVTGVLGAIAVMIARGAGSTDSFDYSVLGYVAAAVIFCWWVLTDGDLSGPGEGTGLRGRVVEALADAVLVVDRAGLVVDANEAARLLLGRAPLRGSTVRAALDRLGPQVLDEGGEYHLPESRRDIQVVVTPLAARGETRGRLLILRDVTAAERERARRADLVRDLRRQVDTLTALAVAVEDSTLTDPVTGLAGRRHLLDCLDALVSAADETGCSCTVVRLVAVTDHGSEPDDDRLRDLAAHLLACAPPRAICGRLRGAGFGVLLPDREPDAALRVVEAMRTVATAQGLVVAAGVAGLGADAEQPYVLLARAEEALDRARDGGGAVIVG